MNEFSRPFCESLIGWLETLKVDAQLIAVLEAGQPLR